MPAEVKKEIRLEIARVLFLDVVGYSKLLVDGQRVVIDELNAVVRQTDEYQQAESANRLIKIPTGDRMALVFYSSPEDERATAGRNCLRMTFEIFDQTLLATSID
jgi:hypothetical protein